MTGRSHSILFDGNGGGARPGALEEPPYFSDLNLDQVLEAMTAGRDEYDLKPFFYAPLRDVDGVRYRHEVVRDLEREPVRAAVLSFAQELRSMREQLAQARRLHHELQRQRFFLDAVETYCRAVRKLERALAALEPASRGLLALRAHLGDYTRSERFVALVSETEALRDALGAIAYAVHIRGNRVRVSAYEGEPDYSAEIERTFAKFRQGAVDDHRVRIADLVEMNHVEARVLELVAKLNREVFGTLDEYCARHRDYLDPTIAAFDREAQFYLAYLDYVAPLEAAGLRFCYPEVSVDSREIRAAGTFDLALAKKLSDGPAAVVCNDFFLEEPERVFVATGPNQGGKTTFARTFGQLHHLAGLGLPVPGREAALFLPDRIFTHFEREEDLATLRGKLEDELVRIHAILGEATGDSVVVMNESFGSTTLRDALFIGREVLGRIVDLGALCVYVTFVDELASLGEQTVSLVAGVAPDNPALRTYELARRPADGLAYAGAIAEKYGLDYESLRGRVAR